MAEKSPYSRSISQLSKERYSCRSYAATEIEPALLEKLEKYAASVKVPLGSRLRFGIIDSRKVRAENLFSTGSYGLIKGARFYLAVVIRDDDPRRWEDAGFAMEAALLRSTDLGLGSCWIGGVFDRRRFGRSLRIEAGEQLPAVVALGQPAERKTLRDRLVRWGARGDLRKPPAQVFFSRDWRTPLRYTEFPDWAQVLENVRLGPSASNKQPWRIVSIENGFHFFLCRDKAYSALMPHVDL